MLDEKKDAKVLAEGGTAWDLAAERANVRELGPERIS